MERYQSSPQYLLKMNVWAGILCNAIIGSLFINRKFYGRIFADMLDRRKEACIIHEVENQRNVDETLLETNVQEPQYVHPARE